jgi:pimeloyl-ACP methyl ester carboxylesterase
VFAVQRAPERFHAYVSTGQMVNNRLTDQMFYEDALAWADGTGNRGLAERMRAVGLPPYEDLNNYEHTVSYEHQWNAYPGVGDLSEMPFNTFVPENTFMDRVNAMRGMFDVNWFVYPQLQDHDFRRDVTRLAVPVYLVHGRYEARGRDVPLREWFEVLEAPTKELRIFERSGHRPTFEQPAAFVEVMLEVLAETAAGRA